MTILKLSRDGKEVMRGTELECAHFIHNQHCYSLDHALKHEGYSLELVYDAPTYRRYENPVEQWNEWKRQAAVLDTSELARHASIPTSNRHSCRECFCCAAGEVLRERKAFK